MKEHREQFAVYGVAPFMAVVIRVVDHGIERPALPQTLRANADDIDRLPVLVGYLQGPFVPWLEFTVDTMPSEKISRQQKK